MILGAVNEEEFIEMERKWIRGIYVLLSLWLLLAGPFYFIYDNYVINMTSLSLLLLLFLPVYQHTKKAKEFQNLWRSLDDLFLINIKYFYMFILVILLFMVENLYLLWLWDGADIFGTDPILVLPLVLSTIISFAGLHYYAVSIRKKWKKFEKRRTTLLNLSLEATKDIIIKALKNLNTDYSEPENHSILNGGRRFVELDSGIKIAVVQNLNRSQIIISDIPKNDTIEPKIEAEILKLANEKVHRPESDK